MRDKITKFFRDLQQNYCTGLETADGSGTFVTDDWTRTDKTGSHGGGGVTRIISNGHVFERGGVNYSEVYGLLPSDMTKKLLGTESESKFFATGVSLVLHPLSPMIPTVHANFRYLEVDTKRWFGGGTDLTPYYVFEEDCSHFHSVLKHACDQHNAGYYPEFKKWCDQYFYLPHRGEARGIGGIFFDYLGKDDPSSLPDIFNFIQHIGPSFLDAYVPIVFRRKSMPWGEREKQFQLIRRGRYVEFNLIHDRGTLFGLRTGGRTESILMSLPPEVRWEYCQKIEEGSAEEKLLKILTNPRDW